MHDTFTWLMATCDVCARLLRDLSSARQPLLQRLSASSCIPQDHEMRIFHLMGGEEGGGNAKDEFQAMWRPKNYYFLLADKQLSGFKHVVFLIQETLACIWWGLFHGVQHTVGMCRTEERQWCAIYEATKSQRNNLLGSNKTFFFEVKLQTFTSI